MEKQFTFRNFVYKEEDGTFTGVCLDLDIIEEYFVTPQAAMVSLNDAILSHIKASSKFGFPEELVKRPAPKEYWDKLAGFLKPQQPKIANPFCLTSETYSNNQYA